MSNTTDYDSPAYDLHVERQAERRAEAFFARCDDGFTPADLAHQYDPEPQVEQLDLFTKEAR